MKKQVEIIGIDASYETTDPDIDAPDIPERYKVEYREQVRSGFRFWGGPPKKPRRAWRDDVALKKRFRDEEQAKRNLEQYKKTAADRARTEYQASLNVSTLPPGMFESEPQISGWQFAIAGFVIIALCLLSVLAMSYVAHV